MIIAHLFRLIVVYIDRAYIGGNGSIFVSVPPIVDDGTIVVIVALDVVPLNFSPEAPLPHISIANWQVFDLIRMHSTLL